VQTVQAELPQFSRAMTASHLLASIAHEVNQPIGSARKSARAALKFLDRSPLDLGWLARSGILPAFPEVDRAEWFDSEAARSQILTDSSNDWRP